MNRKIEMLMAVMGLVGLSSPISAAVVLTDGINGLTFDESTATVTSWTVGGKQQLGSIHYTIQVGSGSFADFASPSIVAGGNPGDDFVTVSYANGDYNVAFEMTLTGAKNNTMLSTTVSFTSLNSGSTNVSIKQASDFNLNATAGSDTLVTLSSSGARQQDGVTKMAQQFSLVSSQGFPAPTYAATGTSSDISFAYVWSSTFGSGNSDAILAITQTLSTTAIPNPSPEPSSLLGLAALMAPLAGRRRR